MQSLQTAYGHMLTIATGVARGWQSRQLPQEDWTVLFYIVLMVTKHRKFRYLGTQKVQIYA